MKRTQQQPKTIADLARRGIPEYDSPRLGYLRGIAPRRTASGRRDYWIIDCVDEDGKRAAYHGDTKLSDA